MNFKWSWWKKISHYVRKLKNTFSSLIICWSNCLDKKNLAGLYKYSVGNLHVNVSSKWDGRILGHDHLSRFFPQIDQIFPGRHLIQFLANKIQEFQNFVLHNCILIFDAEQVYLKPQVTKINNKEVAANPTTQMTVKSFAGWIGLPPGWFWVTGKSRLLNGRLGSGLQGCHGVTRLPGSVPASDSDSLRLSHRASRSD